MNPWINFLVVICMQFLFFLLLLYKLRAFKKITCGLLIKSVVAGVLLGVTFDLLVGKYLGIFSYILHLGLPFLILNGALSYGLWILTLQLLQSECPLSFCVWTSATGLVYEVVNYFYPVWFWTFNGSFLFQEVIVIFVGYCGGALLLRFLHQLQQRLNPVLLKSIEPTNHLPNSFVARGIR
jgi:hypothetical protein